MQLVRSWIDLFYPPLCIHCQCIVGAQSPLFCSPCLDLIDLIDPEERCPRCFSQDYSKHRGCLNCLKGNCPFNGLAAAFDYEGPPASLVKTLKHGGRFYLAKGAASFLVAQWNRLGWPFPDIVIPVPISRGHWFRRGFNQSALIAHEFGLFLERPVSDCLMRQSGHLAQTGLPKHLRNELPVATYTFNTTCNIRDKIVILIDDVTTTGRTLQVCGQALAEGCPKEIYALTVCKTHFS